MIKGIGGTYKEVDLVKNQWVIFKPSIFRHAYFICRKTNENDFPPKFRHELYYVENMTKMSIC